jgi:hypothetical protein
MILQPTCDYLGNFLPQTSQGKGLSPLWTLTCRCSLERVVYVFPHTPQRSGGFSSSWILAWASMSARCVNWQPQNLHMKQVITFNAVRSRSKIRCTYNQNVHENNTNLLEIVEILHAFFEKGIKHRCVVSIRCGTCTLQVSIIIIM